MCYLIETDEIVRPALPFENVALVLDAAKFDKAAVLEPPAIARCAVIPRHVAEQPLTVLDQLLKLGVFTAKDDRLPMMKVRDTKQPEALAAARRTAEAGDVSLAFFGSCLRPRKRRPRCFCEQERV